MTLCELFEMRDELEAVTIGMPWDWDEIENIDIRDSNERTI